MKSNNKVFLSGFVVSGILFSFLIPISLKFWLVITIIVSVLYVGFHNMITKLRRMEDRPRGRI